MTQPLRHDAAYRRAARHPETHGIADAVAESWRVIAPFWPLENLIAVNPLQGFEQLPIEQALEEGARYFQHRSMPGGMEAVNRISIKWLQAFFDEGQATLAMPQRAQGLYAAWRALAPYDAHLHGGDAALRAWLEALPESAEAMIAEGLLRLGIAQAERVQFLTLLLTTLPGWAAHVKYRTAWAAGAQAHPVSAVEYLAMRMAICCAAWPEAKALLGWHAAVEAPQAADMLRSMTRAENAYRVPLLAQLSAQTLSHVRAPEAQFVFCIDVRSEPMRRAVEAAGRYETFGFAGFFGVPVALRNRVTQESHASCPVLLKPHHTVEEAPCCAAEAAHATRAHARRGLLLRFYQSLKYGFTTPFALAELAGPASGAWMALRSLSPRLARHIGALLRRGVTAQPALAPQLEAIPFDDQCAYAYGALRTMGLTRQFAPLVVLCGHGSTTLNNAYASALDCGACGGHRGAGNARVLAAILNQPAVRAHLAQRQVEIPARTRFIAAEHDTATDTVQLFTTPEDHAAGGMALLTLQADLHDAREHASAARLRSLGAMPFADGVRHTDARSCDWAQVRPEWGLARNAAFLVGPRSLSRQLDLGGRCFLHSYDYAQDADGTALTTILTAPMVVAEWINTQYLFSTLDNVAYGGGSKVTKNITGKLGIMQGNASDLMTGLPLQSVFASDSEAYHEPQRLMTVVYAPRTLIDRVVGKQAILRTLFGNGWVTLAAIEPADRSVHMLGRDLSWTRVS